ncbi:lipoprotein-anchoring transpeptidase ErfK/SrfK [Haloferula luteola]|uniref:Lipoprotein-anchoring transpeptidase ErfK/SrfK n=1 Tax=Haloferula luteola TaxID=595692 RepID=A0A840UZ75_9BACT|nr:L,D-transpeptidase [Haloferula luteola]MBB5351045.1 lipoprotein-anchoring transpeptidase ErfK/SrfK [Haloferula luteola]
MTGKLRKIMVAAGLLFGCALLSNCGTSRDDQNQMLVSVRDQQLLLVHEGKPVKAYKISTSKFGLGSRNGSNCTPLGHMEVARKIGDGAPSGMVFKNRRPTGEVLRPNAPGRDPIVGRILWLHGKESQNRNTYGRCIYIHGTPEEWRLGSPASYGCIRMAQKDVVDLYNRVGVGAEVRVIRGSLLTTPEGLNYAQKKADARFMGYTAFRR